MANLKKEIYLKIILVFSLATLLAAYFIEYILGYQPCNLCIIERIPYTLAIIIVIFNFMYKNSRDFFNVLLLLIFAFSILISLYHIGIERGIIDENEVCASKNIDLIDKDDILKSLKEISINCKDVAFKIFGLSLTTYNMILSIIMFLITIKIYLANNGFKK